MEKHILIKKFGNQKKGDTIFIHSYQAEYFVEQGFIEGKTKKKTKKKVEAENTEVENKIN